MMTTPPPRSMTYNEQTVAKLRERIAADQQRLDTMELRELCNKLFILLQRMDMKHQNATEAQGSDTPTPPFKMSLPELRETYKQAKWGAEEGFSRSQTSLHFRISVCLFREFYWKHRAEDANAEIDALTEKVERLQKRNEALWDSYMALRSELNFTQKSDTGDENVQDIEKSSKTPQIASCASYEAPSDHI